MVGIKLVTEFKTEVEKYLGLPYARNHWEALVLTKEAVFGGKGTWQDLEYATKCAAEKESINYLGLSSEEKYQLQKRNQIGIDCSGLAYHLLNKIDQLKGAAGIYFKVTGVDKAYGVLGARAISAAELCHEKNAVKININDAALGDMIRMDGGKHVLVVVDKEDDELVYVHSSERTSLRGVHYGRIKMINKNTDLNFQQWSDTTLDNKNYANLYFPELGDGIFRLKIWN